MSWKADPFYPALKRFILDATGLDYYTEKDDDLFNRLQRRFGEIGVRDCAAYLTQVQARAGELDALINELTIGETYFFRHREQYDALRSTILPELLKANASTKRLNIWSAGCSIGPEPYSVAILLQEHFREVMETWAFKLVGTDINREALLKARLGTYEEWSLRSLDESIRARYFEAKGRKFHLQENIKRAVAFEYHNLITEPFAPPSSLSGALDIIICRNVTIYFDAPTCARLVKRFEECLAPGGWLVVGHSEPNLEYFQNFETVQSPGAILYRKPLVKSAVANAPFAFSGISAAPALAPLPPRKALPLPAVAKVAPVKVPRPVLVFAAESIQSHLERGEFKAALDLCDRQGQGDTLNPVWQFYRGKALEELKRVDEAEAALKKCLYLNRDFVMGHLTLGALYLKSNRAPAARRHFEAANRILGQVAEDHVYPEAGNLKASELKSLVRMHLEAA
ncbi:MAG: methyltransferase domain-containing protein [Proteobacteria bacterium]|nr:MAG: methyltransferase domain-containing protein [Pseudomonadota bacterium]